MHCCRLSVACLLAVAVSMWSLAARAQAPAAPSAAPRTESPAAAEPRVLRDLPYVENGHERQKLDLYLPSVAENDDAKGADSTRWPVVVWVHGGAWRSGNKERCPLVDLTREGFAVASVNYRLSQHAIFPAQIHDVKAAIRWLRANAEKHRLDPERIGAHGASAGGHLVALLGTSGDVEELEGEDVVKGVSSRVQAVVNWFGPTDFTLMNAQSKVRGPIDHDSPDAPEGLLIGGAVQQNKEKAARANPIVYVSPDDPPMLIIHGDDDRLVPVAQSEILAEALEKAKCDVTLYIVKGGGHGGWRDPEPAKMTREFFRKHLQK